MLKVDQIARSARAHRDMHTELHPPARTEPPRDTHPEPAPKAGRGWRKAYVTRMRWSDALALVIALAGTQLVRFQLENAGLELGRVSVPYWIVGAVLGVVWWLYLDMRGARDVRLIGYTLEETRQVVRSTLVLFGAVAIVSFALDIPTARSYVLIALPLGLGLLVTGRHLMHRRLVRERRHGQALSRTMVVGRLPGTTELLKLLRNHPTAGLDASTVYVPSSRRPLPCDPNAVDLPTNALPAGERPSVDGIMDACRWHNIETLVLSANAPLSTREIRHLSWQLADAHVRLVMETGLTDVAGPRIHMQHVAGLPLIHVATPRLSRSRALTKRLMDIALSGTALLALSPLLLVLTVIVRRHDGGPAFFTQERVGLSGERFRMLKFRTMRTDAEQVRHLLMEQNQGHGLLFKLREDPRITAPGRWMRRYSLDELPQLLNVLRGDMSLVGPRPPLPAEVDLYEDYVHRRLRVQPGITGLWQVSGRSNLDWEQSVRLDLYYVENWSPLQDILIMARTFKAVVAKDGAY